ncbi:MAG: hypothetical protein P3M72_00075 [Candidatus Hodgkinia cicadicola]|nr:MAG: hypothetical protein P3M72_00075 [Candidatus Hodgkinia cicadicola]
MNNVKIEKEKVVKAAAEPIASDHNQMELLQALKRQALAKSASLKTWHRSNQGFCASENILGLHIANI